VDFGCIPPGLNQDEASPAHDAYALIHHGVDRHGYRLPVVLVSWGSGMEALAALPVFFVLLRDTISARRNAHGCSSPRSSCTTAMVGGRMGWLATYLQV